MSLTAEEAHEVFQQAELLHSDAEVEAAIERMAQQITAHLADANPVVLCVMTGAVIFAGRLLPKLRFPLQIDYLNATRYGHATRGGELEWRSEPRIPLEGRSVLVLDDILDEGHTLVGIEAYCREKGASEVLNAVLVEKLHMRKAVGAMAHFAGIQVADRFLFGGGMDYKGYWRNAPGIYAVKGL
ncbi:hypoxanthine-guanine phosphoribosyltransferase [Endothiovibrio diazotrophicus]